MSRDGLSREQTYRPLDRVSTSSISECSSGSALNTERALLENQRFEQLRSRINARIELAEFHMEHRNQELQCLSKARAGLVLDGQQYGKAKEAIEVQFPHIRMETYDSSKSVGCYPQSAIDHQQELVLAQDTDVTGEKLIDNLSLR